MSSVNAPPAQRMAGSLELSHLRKCSIELYDEFRFLVESGEIHQSLIFSALVENSDFLYSSRVDKWLKQSIGTLPLIWQFTDLRHVISHVQRLYLDGRRRVERSGDNIDNSAKSILSTMIWEIQRLAVSKPQLAMLCLGVDEETITAIRQADMRILATAVSMCKIDLRRPAIADLSRISSTYDLGTSAVGLAVSVACHGTHKSVFRRSAAKLQRPVLATSYHPIQGDEWDFHAASLITKLRQEHGLPSPVFYHMKYKGREIARWQLRMANIKPRPIGAGAPDVINKLNSVKRNPICHFQMIGAVVRYMALAPDFGYGQHIDIEALVDMWDMYIVAMGHNRPAPRSGKDGAREAPGHVALEIDLKYVTYALFGISNGEVDLTVCSQCERYHFQQVSPISGSYWELLKPSCPFCSSIRQMKGGSSQVAGT